MQATKWQYSLPAFNSHVKTGWLRVNKWRIKDHGHIYLIRLADSCILAGDAPTLVK